MAHWIIDDHGFGGQFYKFSNCGDTWCDLYRNISMEENCPSCGEHIDEDLTEYVENKKRHVLINPLQPAFTYLRKYDKLDSKLIALTGYDIEQLIEKFAAGYTLEPPKDNARLMNILRECVE